MAEEEKSFTVRDKRSSATENSPEQPVDEKGGELQAEQNESKEQSAPPLNFSTFILSLSSSAAINFGGYQDPVSGHLPRNLKLAKQSIDILAILHEKTSGNLNEKEKSLLESALYELRMKYVEEVKKG